MERPAHIGSLATRLNNLERKFDEGPGGGGDLVQRLYRILLRSANNSYTGAAVESDNEFIYDTSGRDMHYAIWGSGPGGGTSQAIQNALAGDYGNPFYGQVFQDGETRFLGYNPALSSDTVPLATLTFGSADEDPDADFAKVLKAAGTSLASATFGSDLPTLVDNDTTLSDAVFGDDLPTLRDNDTTLSGAVFGDLLEGIMGSSQSLAGRILGTQSEPAATWQRFLRKANLAERWS